MAVNYEAFENDSVWDGLKGYVTNTFQNTSVVIESYQNLWQVEKAFRMSKSDLRFGPIYHYKENRIRAHLLICFVAYAVYKELERQLKLNNIGLSVEKAIHEVKQIQELKYQLPKSRKIKTQLLNLNPTQQQLLNMSQL